MEYSVVDGMRVNITTFNETMSQAATPRHYHTKSFVQYAYWVIALLQVSVSVYLSVCLLCVCLSTACVSVSSHYTTTPSLLVMQYA